MENYNFKTESNIINQEIRETNNNKVESKNLISAESLDCQIISKFELFLGVEPELIRLLLSKCQLRTLTVGEMLMSPGEENRYLYLLLSGYLRVYLTDSGDAKFNREMGFKIVPGEYIGEMSIIENKPVSAYVVAAEDCQLLAIHEQVFWGELFCLPGVLKNLLQGLSNRMRKRDEMTLKNLQKHLEFEHLQKELAAASKIQTNILPHDMLLFPNHPQADVAAAITPAKEVGGDFFDAFALDEKHICIAVGDVSGKGIPAALFMIRVITLLRISISRINPLGTIVESINRHLCENNDDCMFVTMFVGIFDVTSGKLTYVNGGHNKPFFARKEHDFELLNVPKGMLLGIYEDAEYTAAELKLQMGDTLVLYTDGVTEAEDKERCFFSTEKTGEILNTLKQQITAQEVVNSLQKAVFDFAHSVPQSDDITILVLRYLGKTK